MANVLLASVLLSAVLIQESVTLDLSGCAPRPAKKIDAVYNLQGNIQSPGFAEGQNYPNNLNCEYRIVAPAGYRIKLTFKSMDVDPFDMCMKDRLLIHEGPDSRGPVHGVFCGSDKPNPILSLRNSLTIVFKSDFLKGRKGFDIEYSVGLAHALCPLGKTVCRNRNCYKIIGERCNGVDDCGDGTDEENCGLPAPVTTCGTTPIVPDDFSYGLDRVVGGQKARAGSWPWQADLQIAHFHPNGHNCGGTLINAQWVVTAAHCVRTNYRTTDWRVHLGNYRKFEKDQYEQVRHVKRIIVYPGFTGDQELRFGRMDFRHDLALMQLNAPVKFTDHVRPACLPPQGYEVAAGTKCVATGWGMTRGSGNSEVLKQVSLTIQPAQMCNNPMIPFNPPTMICVLNDKGFNDVCHGDSGGPLVCKEKNIWYVVGATSAGTKTNFQGGLCALPGARTMYTKISNKTSWINQMIQMYNR